MASFRFLFKENKRAGKGVASYYLAVIKTLRPTGLLSEEVTNTLPSITAVGRIKIVGI